MAFYCCFGLLKKCLGELFGESWPCGEEVFLIADSSVDVQGLHSLRWRKVQRSDFDLVPYRLPAK